MMKPANDTDTRDGKNHTHDRDTPRVEGLKFVHSSSSALLLDVSAAPLSLCRALTTLNFLSRQSGQ